MRIGTKSKQFLGMVQKDCESDLDSSDQESVSEGFGRGNDELQFVKEELQQAFRAPLLAFYQKQFHLDCKFTSPKHHPVEEIKQHSLKFSESQSQSIDSSSSEKSFTSKDFLIDFIVHTYKYLRQREFISDIRKTLKNILEKQLQDPSKLSEVYRYFDQACWIIHPRIEAQPDHIKYLLLLILSSESFEKIQQIFQSQKVISESEVYKEKLLKSLERLTKPGLTKEREDKILKGFLKAEKLSQAKIRQACTKNLVNFFAKIILKIWRQFREGNVEGQEGRVSAVGELQKLMQRIGDEIWRNNFSQWQIYREILRSEVSKEGKAKLKMYYVCFVPRLNEIREQQEEVKKIWKYRMNSHGKKIRKNVEKEISYETAIKLIEKWQREEKRIRDSENGGEQEPNQSQNPNQEKTLVGDHQTFNKNV